MSTARHGISVAGPGRPTGQRQPIVARLRSGIQNGDFCTHQQHATEMFRIHFYRVMGCLCAPASGSITHSTQCPCATLAATRMQRAMRQRFSHQARARVQVRARARTWAQAQARTQARAREQVCVQARARSLARGHCLIRFVHRAMIFLIVRLLLVRFLVRFLDRFLVLGLF